MYSFIQSGLMKEHPNLAILMMKNHLNSILENQSSELDLCESRPKSEDGENGLVPKEIESNSTN